MHQDLDKNEILTPGCLFFFGLGQTPVSRSIGRFVVKQFYTNRNDKSLNSVKELPVVLCSQTPYASMLDRIENSHALYCLEDYTQYQVKGDIYDDEMYSVQASFEFCTTTASCYKNAIDYAKKKTFRFPLQQSLFDPTRDPEDMIVKRLSENIMYPFTEGSMLKSKIMLEQAMLTSNNDWIGI